jgi:alkaline phosphatase
MKIKIFFFFLLFSYILFAQDKPKNIIILIGDGMGVNYVSASYIALDNDPFKKFTSVGLSATSSLDRLVTDSAAGATAISTGHRTSYFAVSVTPANEPLLTLFEHAETLNKATGVIATSTVTHATPAAFLAHVLNRKDETEIARQYLERNVDVVIGGGRSFFLPKEMNGKREDNIDLTAEIERKDYSLYLSIDDLLSSSNISNKFYALLDSTSIPKAAERNYTLADLFNKAIERLSLNENGFLLMVEGSQIDWGGHDNDQEYLMTELYDFNTAVNAALDFAEKDGNTLVLVTGDHETGGMSINGGNPDGSNLQLKFTTGGHTAGFVGVFAAGPGEELFRGVYDNFMIGRNLFQLLDSNFSF